MSLPTDPGTRPVRYGPPRWTPVALLVLALVLVLAGINTDTPGRIGGGAAVVILLGGALWLAGGPSVAADLDGVTIRGPLRRRVLDWSAVRAVRADTGRRSRAVELDTDDGLLVVTATLLGRVRPEEVAGALNALRARALGMPPG